MREERSVREAHRGARADARVGGAVDRAAQHLATAGRHERGPVRDKMSVSVQRSRED